MKIRVQNGEYNENELVLYCKVMDEECMAVLSLLQERDLKLVATKDEETHIVKPSDILYVEAVDGKTFVYTLGMVLESRQGLSTLQERYENHGFVRIGKSLIVNLYQVERLRSLPNTRIGVTLKNGEKLIVSRHYVQTLKDKLGLAE